MRHHGLTTIWQASSCAGSMHRPSGLRLAMPFCLLLVLSACRFLPWAAAGGSPTGRTDLAITDIRFYAWYYDADADKIRYHELKAFPVEDDTNEYPAFDIVVTVKNNSLQSVNDATLKVTVAYKVGRINREGRGETPEASYERAKKRAKWRRPEFVRQLRVPSISPGQSYPIRVACIDIKEIWQRYSRREQWPYRARVDAFVRAVPGEQAKGNNRMRTDIPIDMLD